MASLYKKVISGKPYWYLREMAWVEGKPKLASERYVGTAAEIEALLEGREQTMRPDRTRHLAFGDLAAAWWVIERLGVAGIIDEVVGARRSDAGASVGTYLALAALNRVVAPRSKRRFAEWWTTTAGDHLVKITRSALDHRRFWDAMHAVDVEQLAEIERRITLAMVEAFAVDVSSLALDMTNFATYIDSTNDKAPIAHRGKAKQKRTDLRLIGLGLVVTRDGGIPLLSHAYAGNKPDVTQFATMIDQLAARHHALNTDDHAQPAELTVVFDAGQNSEDNFTTLAGHGLHYVGSVPPSDHPDLLDVDVAHYRPVPEFDGVHAHEVDSIDALGRTHRGLLTHSDELHAGQSRGLDQSLAKAVAELAKIADVLASGRGRRDCGQLDRALEKIVNKRWVRDIVSVTVTGDTPSTFRLAWQIDTDARDDIEHRLFGKRILITDRQHWTVPEIIAGYRSQSDAEFGFRQLKDPHLVSFSPMNHRTEHNIRVHLFCCVLALTIAHLMRRHARQHGHDHSVRALLDQLAGIEETMLIYPSTGGRPKARRTLTETTPEQDQLADIFDLDRWAPHWP